MIVATDTVSGLCIWVLAMVKYHEVPVMVDPKKAALRGAEAGLCAAIKEQDATLAPTAEAGRRAFLVTRTNHALQFGCLAR